MVDKPIEMPFPLRQCQSCGRFKDERQFILNSERCVECQAKLIQQTEIATPPLPKRLCRSCGQLKEQFHFAGNSDICTRCSVQNHPPTIPKYPFDDIQAHSKMCVHCNELKNKSEFADSSFGDSRLCKVCLQLYLPTPEEIPKPSFPWVKLIIAFAIGGLIF